MHMADALLSPQVGLSFGAVSAGTIAWCASRVRKTLDDHKVPLMGVLGAFVFAAQMINFTIPGTGSSGHIGGGLLLSVLLGPHAAFLTIASVLTIQAFFFADGGLLALGCNTFNLGVFPCFVALPFFRALAGRNNSGGRFAVATLSAAVVGLELGALGVVMETLLSGRSELTLGPFVALMGSIHLPIGIIEGLVTATVIGFVFKFRPELRAQPQGAVATGGSRASLKPVLASLGVLVLLTGGVFAWFASAHPDGLEWSIGKLTGGVELEGSEHGIPGTLGRLQQKTAFLPDYTFRRPADGTGAGEQAAVTANQGDGTAAWPAVDPGTSLSGIVGAGIVLLLAGSVGFLLTRSHENAA
jgi:cobalt/nickel transport system permease protein